MLQTYKKCPNKKIVILLNLMIWIIEKYIIYNPMYNTIGIYATLQKITIDLTSLCDKKKLSSGWKTAQEI